MAPANEITSWDDVPLFDSEQSEAAFWQENRLSVRLMESSVVKSSEVVESVTITLRMDPRMLARIKRLARERFLNYQSMIKQWIAERLERELRERKEY
jgi:predicted DNA binding CopG/RHH family protein